MRCFYLEHMGGVSVTCTVCYTCRNVHIGHRHLQELMSGEAAKERVTPVPSKS